MWDMADEDPLQTPHKAPVRYAVMYQFLSWHLHVKYIG